MIPLIMLEKQDCCLTPEQTLCKNHFHMALPGVEASQRLLKYEHVRLYQMGPHYRSAIECLDI